MTVDDRNDEFLDVAEDLPPMGDRTEILNPQFAPHDPRSKMTDEEIINLDPSVHEELDVRSEFYDYSEYELIKALCDGTRVQRRVSLRMIAVRCYARRDDESRSEEFKEVCHLKGAVQMEGLLTDDSAARRKAIIYQKKRHGLKIKLWW